MAAPGAVTWWADLPTDVLMTMAGMLTEWTDHLNFRLVCRRWNSACLALPPLPLPWALVRFIPTSHVRYYQTLSDRHIYSIQLSDIHQRESLENTENLWPFMRPLDGRTFGLSLINPYTRSSFSLPCSGCRHIKLWAHSPYSALAACPCRPYTIFFVSLGGSSWKQAEPVNAISISYHADFFFVLTGPSLKIVAFNASTFDMVDDFPNLPEQIFYPNPQFSLTVSSDGLLVLVSVKQSIRIEGRLHSLVLPSNLYKIDCRGKDRKWVLVQDLGDRAIFCGMRSCFVVNAGGPTRLKRNHIYYPIMDRVFVWNLGRKSYEVLDFWAKILIR